MDNNDFSATGRIGGGGIRVGDHPRGGAEELLAQPVGPEATRAGLREPEVVHMPDEGNASQAGGEGPVKGGAHSVGDYKDYSQPMGQAGNGRCCAEPAR